MSRNPEDTRNRILDAALGVFAGKGYHDARLDEIAGEAELSKGAIYFHFPNKERLFLALLDQFANLLERRIVAAIEQETRGIDRARVALEVCVATFGKYRRQAKVLLVQAMGLGLSFENKQLEIKDRFAALIQTYLDQAVAAGEIVLDDTELVSHIWMSAIYGVMVRWVYTGEPSADHITEVLVPMLLRSVGYDDA